MGTKTKIFLADLAHTYSVNNRSLTVPLGIGYIKAYANKHLNNPANISLFKHPDRFLNAVHHDRPEIIGFANYGWNENLNRDIGRYVSELLPDTLIVAGGPNIDRSTDRRLSFLKKHPYIDYLIIDGGEEPFTELCNWWLGEERDRKDLPNNLVWRTGEILHETGDRVLRKQIENIPSPYLAGHLDEFLEAGMTPLFETNRGCPFRCSFCAWGAASKDLLRRLDLETVLAEIEHVSQRSNARNWIFCDANFGILPRDVEIAHAIRKAHENQGLPKKCHVWLAKNVTRRNLEIGEILGDMTVPVMAVQSLDRKVLANIKRDNISTETYAEYQSKFHSIGSRTYSDLIVPLPGETRASHIDAIRTLLNLGVDIVQNHNMRLLAGAETNSTETRQAFGFKTRYRLIHGDAGRYRTANGAEIRTFEYEESLRASTTMSEEDLFYLRKLHFLVDFCWNTEVYKPLLQVGHLYGLNPVDVLTTLLERSNKSSGTDEFFSRFDKSSHDEWFDSPHEIESYFSSSENFARLTNQEFEKLNVLFSVILLREYKQMFDRMMVDILQEFGEIPDEVLESAAKLCLALYPSLSLASERQEISIPDNFHKLNGITVRNFIPSKRTRTILLAGSPARTEVHHMLANNKGQTLSKILNTQGVALRDLKLSVTSGPSFDKAFHRREAKAGYATT